MGLLLENFKMALSSVKANKMRTFLTMLGIVIGISSVIAIASVGDATGKTMDAFLKGLGENRTMISLTFEGDEFPQVNEFFSFDDIDLLKDKFSKEIAYISSQADKQLTITRENKEANIITYPSDYNYIKELAPTTEIIHGRDFLEEDIKRRKNYIIVDKEFAMKLFGRENVVSEQIDVKASEEVKTFTIIGVFTKETTVFDSLNTGDATFASMPYTVADDTFASMELKIANGYDPKKMTEKIKKYIARHKRLDEKKYKIATLEEQAGIISGFISTVSLGLGVIAGISLLVGGIGIMNIMLVSVTERTKEIGIRKSLGARQRDILTQFLVESVILSGVGGVIGTILGLIFSVVIATYMNVDPTTPIVAISIAVGFSFFVGILFGIFPAYKASGLNPIDALRYE